MITNLYGEKNQTTLRNELIEKSEQAFEFSTEYKNFKTFPDAMRKGEELYTKGNIHSQEVLDEIKKVNTEILELGNKLYDEGGVINKGHNNGLKPHDFWLKPLEDTDSEFKRFISAADGETIISAGAQIIPSHVKAGQQENISDYIKILKDLSGENLPFFSEIDNYLDRVPGGFVPMFLNGIKIAKYLPFCLDFCRAQYNCHVVASCGLQYTLGLEFFLAKRSSDLRIEETFFVQEGLNMFCAKDGLSALSIYNYYLKKIVASRTLAEEEQPECYWGEDL